MDDLSLFRNRICELSNLAWQNSRYYFSDFLSEADLDEFLRMEKTLSPAGFAISGGRENAGRVMIRFGSEEAFGYTEDFPITYIKVEPILEKFSDDLTHRDFLGALMNLGIERDVLGDLLIEGHTCWIICKDTISSYICENLGQIRHTHVKCTPADTIPAGLGTKTINEEKQVASERIDAVVSAFSGLSRSETAELFRSKKVFLNSRCTENNAQLLHAGDCISARGFGKMRYLGASGQTRKGRLKISSERFV